MKVNELILLILFSVMSSTTYASDRKLTSPDRNITVDINLSEKIFYSVTFKGEQVLEESPLSLTIDDNILGANPEVSDTRQISVDEIIKTVWGSRKNIHDKYNQLTLDFDGGYSVEFRAYNNGVAYRFLTRLKEKQVIVKNEEVSFRFNSAVPAWILDSRSYETGFKKTLLDADTLRNFNAGCKLFRPVTDAKTGRSKIFLPLVLQASPNVKVLVTEAGLRDYPSLFLDLKGDNKTNLIGTFEKYALTTKPTGYYEITDQEADYIARTSGTYDFPWRLLVISDDDRTFADCDLVYQLSRPCALEETNWIKPGKAAWDWWHNYAVTGQNFKGGVNTKTYLHHIDFASKYGLEYILIDAGVLDDNDLTLVNREVDLREIINYGTKKNVKVLIWSPGHALYNQLDKVLDFFVSIGIAGIKTDFFGREDQTGIRMYEDIARSAADRKLLVDFHGAAKPTGLSRTYPNVINYESVAGDEWNKLSSLDDDKITTSHRVILPFTRGAQGPMDFTPGGMRNVQSGHNLRYTLPLVHGSRSGEMALYVLYNEPLKMMSDAPFVYESEPEITRFISEIPTVWDETLVLDARFGEYLVEARQAGKTWYIAGMTGDNAKEVTIDFSFLGEGTFDARILKDGPNADRVGTDYLFENRQITKNSKLTLSMVGGGGFIVRINN